MRVLITAGPTREYLDDVRYLSNASSGRMGYAIAEAVLAAGHDAVLVSGPVALTPPSGCEVHYVETTEELHDACSRLFIDCQGTLQPRPSVIIDLANDSLASLPKPESRSNWSSWKRRTCWLILVIRKGIAGSLVSLWNPMSLRTSTHSVN